MQRWKRLPGCLALAALFGAAGAGLAQETPANTILTIDQERLFIESDFGEAVLAREAAVAQQLEAENARIEGDLITEEQDLTDRRAELSAAEFSKLAAAFDEKVVRIREEQDAKARDLARTREEDRQAFFQAAFPVLGDLLVERRAVAILDKSMIILSLKAIDVTDEAIAKVDAAIGADGEASGEGRPPEPRPEIAPPSKPEVTPTPSP